MPEPGAPVVEPSVSAASEDAASSPETAALASPPSVAPTAGQLVARNAALLGTAQVLMMPISVVVNGAMGRYLGAGDFGVLYLASTFASLGILFVDFGQASALPAAIARDKARSGEFFASAVVWRLAMAAVVTVVLYGVALLSGHDRVFLIALGLVLGQQLLNSLTGACTDTVRGFERSELAAASQVGGAVLNAALTLVALVLIGTLPSVLIAQLIGGACVFFLVTRALKPMGVGRWAPRAGTVKQLLKDGVPFLFFGMVMVAQPYIDALYMGKMVPDEVVGWYAAARKLVGLLLFPVTALIGALYPTLCRLSDTDPAGFRRTASGALRSTAILTVPVALGCALYPDLGVRIFSRESFGPAEQNLRLLAPFICMVYFTMPLGTALLASGRQRLWAMVQSVCLLVSLVADPLLIPYFQQRYGNGGLGVCVATLLSETFMLGAGILLSPKGLFDRRVLRALIAAASGGAAMAAIAYLLRGFSPFLGAPIAVLAYGAAVFLLGGVEREELAAAQAMVMRKLRKRR